MICSGSYSLRPMQPGDRDAIRAICIETCWRGGYDAAAIPSPWFWAEYWTRYFTDCEPEHTWVVVRREGDADSNPGRDGAAAPDGGAAADGRVVGYLTGTTDVARFDRYVTRRLPALGFGLLWRRVRAGQRVCRPALRGLIRAALRGDMHLSATIRRRYPATWHFNLRPEARGRGLGKALLTTFLARLGALGVPGIHVQNLSTSPAVSHINELFGLKLIHTGPTVAFAHLTREPVYIHTWVRAFGATDSG